tara:strand:- start:703 stop:885 length:183 start_codon:yes stop_codon:yes gene_type:complete
MVVDLQAVSTFGWFPSISVAEDLSSISTFGWYGFDEIVANPDIIQFILMLNRTLELTLER